MSVAQILTVSKKIVLLCLALALLAVHGKSADATDSGSSLYQGYVLEIPALTKIPIVFESTVDSDVTQDGDEFLAKTTEDITIYGTVVLPSGSMLRGKCLSVKRPEHFRGTKLIQVKFETACRSNTEQVPIVAHLISHHGLVHIRRQLGETTISFSETVPTFTASLISDCSGNPRHRDPSIYRQPKSPPNTQGHAGALFSKNGKRYQILPADETKIELDEALRLPLNSPK